MLNLNKFLSMNLLSKIKELDRDIQRQPNYVKKTSTEEESKSDNRASYLSSKVSVSWKVQLDSRLPPSVTCTKIKHMEITVLRTYKEH